MDSPAGKAYLKYARELEEMKKQQEKDRAETLEFIEQHHPGAIVRDNVDITRELLKIVQESLEKMRKSELSREKKSSAADVGWLEKIRRFFFGC